MKRIQHLILILLLAWLISSCAPLPEANFRVWIDIPRDGARVSMGQMVNVQSHAYARKGVAEVMLIVNGVPYRRDPPAEPGADFTAISQSWFPEKPGEYALQVIAYDTRGEASSPASVWVSVVALVTATPTPMPEPTLTPTAAATVTPSAIPAAQVNFWADKTSLVQGECTDLHWAAQNVTAVLLDGKSIAALGTKQICPTTTTTYRLHVAAPLGDIDRSVMVAVTVAAPDMSGPNVSGISHSPDVIWNGPTCGPISATVSANVTDPSGISKVELHYRVVKAPTQGSWRTLTMSHAGGSTYQATLGPTELEASLSSYGGGIVEYYIEAQDSQGNVSQIGTRVFEAKACLV